MSPQSATRQAAKASSVGDHAAGLKGVALVALAAGGWFAWRRWQQWREQMDNKKPSGRKSSKASKQAAAPSQPAAKVPPSASTQAKPQLPPGNPKKNKDVRKARQEAKAAKSNGTTQQREVEALIASRAKALARDRGIPPPDDGKYVSHVTIDVEKSQEFAAKMLEQEMKGKKPAAASMTYKTTIVK